MIKKVTILVLFASFSFGATTPVFASIVQRQATCGMECCDTEMDMDMQHSDGMHIQESQTCSVAGQCIPVDIPKGLDVNSTIPVLQTKVKVYATTLFINNDGERTSQRDRVNLSHDFLITPPSNEVISTHSVLIL